MCVEILEPSPVVKNGSFVVVFVVVVVVVVVVVFLLYTDQETPLI